MLLGGRTLWHWDKTVDTDLYPLVKHNYWISTTGRKSGTDTNWISSEKIPVTDCAVVDYYLYSHPNVGNVVAYDASGKVLGYAQNNTNRKYHVPPGTTHITLTGCTEQYSTGFNNQYVTLTDLATEPPKYVEDGLVMWCDGRNNTGEGHSDSVTTWKDLTGNGNDIINTMHSDSTSPASTVRGVWTDTGIWVKSKSNQFLRTLTEFDLGSDYTLEIRVTPMSYQYMTFGFRKSSRFKLRESGKWWGRISESDATGAINTGLVNETPPPNVPVTLAFTRHYNGTNTEYLVYQDTTHAGRSAPSGNYQSGNVSDILIGTETVDLVVHSVRLYNRALTAEEIAFNYEFDKAQL